MKTMRRHNADKRDYAFFPSSIPLEQLPVKEYLDLRESPFFRWAILKGLKYATKLLAVWISSLLLSMFFFAAKSVHHELTLSSFLWSGFIAKIIVLCCLLQLYTAWHYIYLRLSDKKVVYEVLGKSKTYIWQKPDLMLTRDLLIVRFQVRPILRRIEQTILLLLLFFIFDFTIVLINIKS